MLDFFHNIATLFLRFFHNSAPISCNPSQPSPSSMNSIPTILKTATALMPSLSYCAVIGESRQHDNPARTQWFIRGAA